MPDEIVVGQVGVGRRVHDGGEVLDLGEGVLDVGDRDDQR
jgi:hypothetical protein